MQEQLLDVSLEQRAAANLVKRIRKLRWIGMEAEARKILSAALRIISPQSVVQQPETD